MTKAEIISYVKNLLPKIDKTLKYHDNVVAMAIDLAMEQVFHDMYLEDPKHLDVYAKPYSSLSLASLITSWEEVTAFDDFFSASASYMSFSETGSEAYARTNTFSWDSGATYKVSCYYSAASGTAPYLYYGVTYAGKTLIGQLEEGANDFSISSNISSSLVRLYVVNASGSTVTDASLSGFVLTRSTMDNITFSSIGAHPINIPAKAKGVVRMRDENAPALRFIPVSHAEYSQFDVAETGYLTTTIWFTVEPERVVLHNLGGSYLSDTFEVFMIPKFYDLASTDNFVFPYGQDQKVMEYVMQHLSYIRPKDLLTNNADANG